MDNRLQNLESVDIHGFQFANPAGFDPGYSTNVYSHGLNNAQAVHPHTQTHFVPDGQVYFDANLQQQQQQQQQRQSQQSQRQPRRAVSQKSALQNQQPNVNVNINANIDPSLNRNGGQKNATQTQARRSRLAQHPVRVPQQSQPAQYINHLNSPNQLLQDPTIQRSPTTTRGAPASLVTPTQPSRQPNRHVTGPTPLQTPTSATAPTANGTPNPNSSIADQLTAFNPPSTFDFVPDPPDLDEWRERFFNIAQPILLTSEDYHTYFPHVDNIYSHRSTQKYKKKPFVSHYWDCRLKGRPTGQPLPKAKKAGANGEEEDGGEEPKEKKKRKRKTRERDLCDVKIKVTEFFGRDELEALGRLGVSEDDDPAGAANGQLTFVLEDGTTAAAPASAGGAGGIGPDGSMPFGVLEPLKRFPEGHPGAEGKRWYMVQRVNGTGKDGEPIEGADLDHKHTLEESDRIKKNSVQRWLLAQEKGKKKSMRAKNPGSSGQSDQTPTTTRQASVASPASYHASGEARTTLKSHSSPVSTGITLYGSSFCPFAQRIWIALELKGIPYQLIEIMPNNYKDGKCTIPGLLEVCPEGATPCLRHGSWGVWESGVMMEYLEDLSIGHTLLPLGDPRLRAHCRLWVDHINRKILPFFYALLLFPMNDSENDIALRSGTADTAQTSAATRSSLVSHLQSSITDLVNASHATGPFFLGEEISFVDINFAPWIIRLSRVLSYYRDFPRPEVGTRWFKWVTAVEENECVKRTVSDERGYHYVYGGIAKMTSAGKTASMTPTKRFAEMNFAQKIIRTIGFGLGGDLLGKM